MSDRTDLDDCGADLHRWWNEIGRAEMMEQDERINKRATMWECPYCGKLWAEPGRICCKENHTEEVSHEQAE